MEENKPINLRTYAKTWDFDYVIYGYGDLTFPFPLKFTQLGFFAIAFGLVIILTLPFGAHISWLFKIAAAVLLTHLGTNLDIDGKKPYIWLPKQILYLVQLPKTWNKFRPVVKYKDFSFNPIKDVRVG